MSLFSLITSAIDRFGLRGSRAGRGLIATMNVLGNRCTRLLYLRRGRPIVVDGHRVYLSGRKAPSPAFVSDVVHHRYEPETRALLEKLIHKGMTVFDVGAHVGHYTLIAARLAGPHGHVYAFEAEPENFELLKKNVEMNGYTNVTCVHKAVSSASGTLTLYVSRQGNDRHSIINQRNLAGTTEVHVPAVTLDEFVKSAGVRHVDVIKMDIEGAEPMALKGMSALMEQPAAWSLVMEFAPDILRKGGDEPAQFLRTLMKLGISLAPVENAVPRELFETGNISKIVAEAEKHGAINLLCTKHAPSIAVRA